jgi:ADP-ribose pyrophosphatase
MFDVFFDKIKLNSGALIEDYLIVRPKISTPENIIGVCVLPEVNESILLMKSWRHQLNRWLWQAPAGFINSGESVEDAACRELLEETGYICEKKNLIHLINYYPDAGLIEGGVSLFLATKCRATENINIEQEVGLGEIRSFNMSELKKCMGQDMSMGGSTLLACHQFLSTRKKHLPLK